MADTSIDLRIKRYQFAIALTALMTALTVGCFTVIKVFYQEPYVPLEELEPLLRKPFEGRFEYILEFSIYKGIKCEDDTYIANGVAFFDWDSEKSHYEVYIGYSVLREGDVESSVVTGYVLGYLKADESGWPTEDFTMEMTFGGRTGQDGFHKTTTKNYTYDKGTFKKSYDGRRAVTIQASYEGVASSGTVIFKR